jgi:hypothetical protein
MFDLAVQCARRHETAGSVIMIVQCFVCQRKFDDEFRTTICPHETFPANDGENNFEHHPESHLDPYRPRRSASEG